MNIVLFISAMQDGGAESVAATLVNAWVDRGDTVTLVATYSGRSTCNYPVSDRVKFVYLADLVKRGGRGPLAFVERMRALRALMRDSKADVIVSFLTNVNVATILASRGLGIPIIVSEHTNPLADRRSFVMAHALPVCLSEGEPPDPADRRRGRTVQKARAGNEGHRGDAQSAA